MNATRSIRELQLSSSARFTQGLRPRMSIGKLVARPVNTEATTNNTIELWIGALSPVDISELAEQWHERDQRELVRDEQPGQLTEAADVVGDGLAGSCNDEEIERRQRQGQHQSRNDEAAGPSRDGAVVFGRFGACRLHRVVEASFASTWDDSKEWEWIDAVRDDGA